MALLLRVCDGPTIVSNLNGRVQHIHVVTIVQTNIYEDSALCEQVGTEERDTRSEIK